MQHRALSLLRRDSVAYADIIYPILRGDCDIIQADEDGVVVFDKPSGFLFVKLPNTEGSVQKLMQVRGVRGYNIHSDDLADRFQRIARKRRVMRVYQVVYQGKSAPSVPRVCSVRKLTEEDADAVLSRLPYDEEDIRRSLANGQMLGAFIDGELVGRIGVHTEGCMGQLQVMEQFRRRGIGQVLEAQLIKELLSRQITPYGQIERENTASLELARAMGFTVSDRELTILM
ncbi:MAG: GNAT family N-acetyltransferase [Clostridia bacterium]|nr:GNAT family N-acetyltransferase [Clostridia bacterium]MBQ9409943.1 GNAT family N-acetyltransferase [Clostridia bacterium]